VTGREHTVVINNSGVFIHDEIPGGVRESLTDADNPETNPGPRFRQEDRRRRSERAGSAVPWTR
jgi:hypothetical protein